MEALFAGLDKMRSGLTFNFLRMVPINGALLRPRLFRGLSKSSKLGYFQLDLACLTRYMVFMICIQWQMGKTN
jgi:hypothetical protein